MPQRAANQADEGRRTGQENPLAEAVETGQVVTRTSPRPRGRRSVPRRKPAGRPSCSPGWQPWERRRTHLPFSRRARQTCAMLRQPTTNQIDLIPPQADPHDLTPIHANLTPTRGAPRQTRAVPRQPTPCNANPRQPRSTSPPMADPSQPRWPHASPGQTPTPPPTQGWHPGLQEGRPTGWRRGNGEGCLYEDGLKPPPGWGGRAPVTGQGSVPDSGTPPPGLPRVQGRKKAPGIGELASPAGPRPGGDEPRPYVWLL